MIAMKKGFRSPVNAPATIPVELNGYWHIRAPTKMLPKMKGRLARAPKNVEVIWSFRGSVFREILVIDGVAHTNIPLLYDRVDDEYTFVVLSSGCCDNCPPSVKLVRIKRIGQRLHLEKQKLPFNYKAGPTTLAFDAQPIFKDLEADEKPIGVLCPQWSGCCLACRTIHRWLLIDFLNGACCGGCC